MVRRLRPWQWKLDGRPRCPFWWAEWALKNNPPADVVCITDFHNPTDHMPNTKMAGLSPIAGSADARELERENARLREALSLAWRRYAELYSGHGYGNAEETLVAELTQEALGLLPNASGEPRPLEKR